MPALPISTAAEKARFLLAMTCLVAPLAANAQDDPMPNPAKKVSPITMPVLATVYRQSRHLGSGKSLRGKTIVRADRSAYGKGGAVRITGDNLVLDFADLTLRGTPPAAEPDARTGTGLYVQGKHITIRNARVHGYKIGLYAENAPGLKLVNCDFSLNYKPRLKSTPEQEDLSDWMSYHQNEKAEWLRFGAGIYLTGCDGFQIKNVTITGGQNGLMLNRCNKGQVLGCNFSFLSGIGLGMYRSSSNLVQQNRIDWCVRGYSHGVYNRGQDSAGILVYEQSSNNTFAYNSVTHGGDGFFLWAGQTTMDTGEGGCNDNLLLGNDFSHAPTNGIEVTFSRNQIVSNRVLECWHGIWGGYSYDTLIADNEFGYNATSIAIEHGQNNQILSNSFHNDREAIRLWQNATQDPNWAYPKKRDTASHDYKIQNNSFLTSGETTSFKDTANVVYDNKPQARKPNAAPDVMTIAASGNPLLETERDLSAYLARFSSQGAPMTVGVTRDGIVRVAWKNELADPFLKPGAIRGRRFIVVDEWGPYNFKAPLLWPAPPARFAQGEPLNFEVWAPKGTYRVVKMQGVTVQSGASGTSDGRFPSPIAFMVDPAFVGTAQIEMEYRGTATTDYKGNVTPAGKPIRFGWKRDVFPVQWNVRFFPWDKAASDPRTQAEAFAAKLQSTPLASLDTRQLNFAGYGKFAPGVPADYFATVAEGKFQVPGGDYMLDVTTDDGCRVWVDDKPVLTDAWKYQGPTLYPIALTLPPGEHRIRVEHFQIDGYAQLSVNLRPK